eukprot:TRINITY_DN3015_c0_g1_i3.p1 TRINITY_DN3015_c0_g1~~TRINITY_DN3015_c0_g1_i3.p1  ORF type:complete len:231 (+),score=10.77 TRINITY_DN3015_c0_g1_i3:92-694(+)
MAGIRELFIRIYNRVEEEAAKNHLLFQVLIVIQAIACLVLLVLRALEGDFIGNFFTDSIAFYVINIVIYGFGVVCAFRRFKHRSWFLVAYILVVLCLLIASSVGLGKLYSNMTIYQRQCDFAGTDCTDIVRPLVNSVVRQAVLAAVQAITIHPAVSYVITQRQNDKMSILSAMPRGPSSRSAPVSRGVSSRGPLSSRSMR